MLVRNILILVITVTVFTNCAQCLKILGIFFHSGKSHFDVVRPLLESLSEKGHELTVIGSFPRSTAMPNYTDISLARSISPRAALIDLQTFYGIKRLVRYGAPILLSILGKETCIKAFEDDSLKQFLKSEQKFDIIIAELFDTDCLLAINDKFKVPIVGISSSVLMPWHYDRFGLSDNPSYIPSLFLRHTDKIGFFGRVENLVLSQLFKLWFNLVTTSNDNDIAKKYMANSDLDINKISTNISLCLVNSHYTMHQPKPLTPNVIEIGGIHIGKARPLPGNIEKFINESSHGVIYFSLGSMIKGHTFPEEKREQFLKAFARLPQRVLWKWENETMPGKPDNVMIQQWMPQFDILCHPNVKAFISHGGLLGTTEAVHCGVPMIVMPQYGDQHTNARAVEANGGGVIMDLEDATEEKVYDALKTILSPEFNAKTKELSARFRDRPMSPMDTAIYWVEYVARHKGAPHMRTAAVGMPLYQYLLLDVIAFIVFVITVFLLLTFYTLRSIFRLLFRKKEKSEQTNKSKVLQNKKNK